MKRIIALIFALLIFTIPVFAENESKSEVTLTYTEGITLYGDGDEVFGIEKESFSKYIKENNIVLYGIANDKSFVFEMTCNQTEFSKSVKDFKNLKLMDIKDFADSMGILTYNIKSLGEASYIVSILPTSDSESEGRLTQYITIKQDKLYVITVTAAKSVNNDYEQKIIGSIKYNFAEHPAQISVWHIVVVGVAIVLVLIIFVWIVITLIKDLKKRKSKYHAEEMPKEE